MLPSLLARDIQSGMKHFLRTGFEPSDPLFAGVMHRFTDDESRWMKGPFVHIGLPFRTGDRGTAFFPNFKTANPGYVHQEVAWQRLASNRGAASTLVATGTGSGKTECFLYPLLDHALRARASGSQGITSLVIYPMNALATDQARRFASVIASTPEFRGLRVGLFVGGQAGKDGHGQMTMTPAGVITDRETMRKDPPDILLTNYKMLDYLLIRPKDRQLWAKNGPETLRYVVVDELHTFDGAQGTDLAMLLRRLRARLLTPDGHMICVGTSATLGTSTAVGSEASTGALREYARQVFSVDFQTDSVVTENRRTEAEFLGDSPIEYILYARPDMEQVLDPDRYRSQQEAVAAWFPVFFGSTAPSDVSDERWRSELGAMLKRHLLFINLIKVLRGQTLSAQDLQQQMQGPLPESARAHISRVLDALLVLVAWARDADGRPLVTLRVQLWMRELRRMVAQVRSEPESIQLLADIDVRRDPERLYLPLLQCTDCHTTGWLSRLAAGQSRLSVDLEEIYSTWFGHQPEAVRIYAESGLPRPLCDGVRQRLCTQCGQLQGADGPCTSCAGVDLVHILRVSPVRTTTSAAGLTQAWHDATCPACGSKYRQVLMGARNATLGAITVEHTWASNYNDDKKLIAFSDSVQDAAHRAGFFTARTYLQTVRTGLARVIDTVATPNCAWTTFLEQSTKLWTTPGSQHYLPPERFVAEFIGPNMMWQRDWAAGLTQRDLLPQASRLPARVEKRLAWQAFSEFTYLSRRGRTLENIGKATVAPRMADIARAAELLLPALHEEFGIRHATLGSVVQWLWGLLCHLRQRGAVALPDLLNYAIDGNFFQFRKLRNDWLPLMGEHGPRPLFLSLSGERGYDPLVAAQGQTFYQTWLKATVGAGGLLPVNADRDIYTRALDALIRAGLVQAIAVRSGKVFGLNPSALVLETEVVRLVSDQGKRALTVPADAADALIGMPCLEASQESYAAQVPAGGRQATRLSRNDLRRVFSAEHTGLLERGQREALEERFKAKVQQPWHENLLSATPTLEMGVDIGDLSSVLLCSVPPTRASFLQRIGRAGRRDGNAFTTTLADGTSPHDLYFFEDTNEMLQGEVVPPGIFLKAAEVLRRQLFAFCLDAWVGSGIAVTALPDKTKDAVDAHDSGDQSRFPYTFLEYVLQHEEQLLAGFKTLLGADLDDRLAKRLDEFMKGTDADDGMRVRMVKLVDELAVERKAHRERGERIKKQVKNLKAQPADEATKTEVELLERERGKAIELIKEINSRDLLNTLTDAGLIPNYAFPEIGVELKSILWRNKSDDDPKDARKYVALPAEKYERPAQSALSEFAPENVFYANQRKVEIDQITFGANDLETWRLCPTCQHMENISVFADAHAACPRCQDPMWVNISQKHQLLRFRQAIANSNDTEVRIDDTSDDREPKFYLRQLLADFEPTAVKEAYRLTSPDTPFGFEFIERVTFRDVNFGEPTKPGDSYSVAGQKKQRPGFKLCRHCGKVQRPPRTKRERDNPNLQLHAYDCEQRDGDEPASIVECLYLYREFTSEALRILMPYTGSGADDEAVQSFMAAVRLGLKQRFGGRVDHLRMTVQEQREQPGAPARQYVMLYDSVPGGTGYLHELLANNAITLVDVLRLALKQLTACSCNAHVDKDGCYRCVYQYRLGRAMALVSRDRARLILEQLVGNLDQLERVATVADIDVNPNFDSALEARFIQCLRRLSGKGGLPPIKLVQDMVGGKSGYLLEIGEQRYWIEPQVDLGPEQGVVYPCRPDFVIRPARSQSSRKPFAVFCDGWEYHQRSTREDARKRSALVASGGYWVWSVTWEDVKAAMDGKLPTELTATLDPMCRIPVGGLPAPLRAMNEETVWSEHAVAALLRWLSKPPGTNGDQYASRVSQHGTSTAFRMMPNPADPLLADARARLNGFWRRVVDHPCQEPPRAASCGNTNEEAVTLRYWWPSEALAPTAGALPPSPGFLVFDDSQLEVDLDRHLAWRRWLWLFNVFQTLPGLVLATVPGIEGGDHAALAFAAGNRLGGGPADQAEGAAWQGVLDQVMAILVPALRSLMESGVALPDEVGYELASDTGVQAEAELAWLAQKVVVLVPEAADAAQVWRQAGWTAIVAEDGWPEQLSAALSVTSTSAANEQGGVQ